MTQKILAFNNFMIDISSIIVLSTLIIIFLDTRKFFFKVVISAFISALIFSRIPEFITGKAAIITIVTGIPALLCYRRSGRSFMYITSLLFISIYFMARQIFMFLISLYTTNPSASAYILLSSDFFSLIVICVVSGISLHRRKNHTAYICMLLLIMLMMLNTSNLLVLHENSYNLYLIVLNSSTFVTLLFLLMLDLKMLRDTKLKNDEYLQLQNSMKGMRSYIHNNRNLMHALAGYIQMRDFEGLNRYFVQIRSDLNSLHHLQDLNEFIKEDPGLFGIIRAKQLQAEKLDLDFRINFTCRMISGILSSKKLYKIIGILLDNAFEAALESTMKYIEITLTGSQIKGHLVFEICNSVMPGHKVVMDNIFSYGYTTKSNHMGIGLWELKKILDKSGLEILTDQTGDLFLQRIVLK